MARYLAAALAAMTLTGTACASEVALPDHVRILDCRLAAAVAYGAAHSPTFNELLERVQRTDGLIYIRRPPIVGPATSLRGGLSHKITTAGGYRVLWIFVTEQPRDRAIETVGHELRHALEVLELSTARSEAEADELFNRIGWHTRTNVVETQAALDAGGAIARELDAAKAHPQTWYDAPHA